jgi:hypothetical protein
MKHIDKTTAILSVSTQFQNAPTKDHLSNLAQVKANSAQLYGNRKPVVKNMPGWLGHPIEVKQTTVRGRLFD